MDDLTIFVCTYNSGSTLAACLESLLKSSPGSKIVVVDHHSADLTLEISRRFGAEVHEEGVSLGHARQLCFDLVESGFMAFVDSDVEVVNDVFFSKAVDELRKRRNGAVVGTAVRHKFAYGLPASLLVLRSSDFRGISIPDYVDARETFYIQERLNHLKLRTVYLADAMVHRSQYRGFKPEWEGANTRIVAGLSLSQLAFAFRVVTLIGLNSRRLRNIAYIPLFYLKFLRGFVNPSSWSKLDRPARRRSQ
jgi:glycosyltransferase involved in cell wall biosynthesis